MGQQTSRRKETAVVAPTEIAAEVVRDALGDLLNRAGFLGEQFIITRHGKPVAALISAADLKRLNAA